MGGFSGGDGGNLGGRGKIAAERARAQAAASIARSRAGTGPTPGSDVGVGGRPDATVRAPVAAPVGAPASTADVVAAAITGGSDTAPITIAKKRKAPILGGGGFASVKLGN